MVQAHSFFLTIPTYIFFGAFYAVVVMLRKSYLLMRRHESYRRALRRKELLQKGLDLSSLDRADDHHHPPAVPLTPNVSSIASAQQQQHEDVTATASSSAAVRPQEQEKREDPAVREMRWMDRKANASLAAYESGIARPTAELRGFHHEIKTQTSWEGAVAVFLEGVIGHRHPTAQTFAVLLQTIHQQRVKSFLPAGTLEGLLAESQNGTEERWPAEPDEIAAYVQYHTRNAARSETGSLYVDHTTRTLREGADTPLSTQLEFLMRRHQVVPQLTTIADAMQMNIHWAAALRWMQFAREVSNQQQYPLMEMYDRTVRLMTAPRSSFSSRPWLTALRLVEEALSTGYQPTVTLFAGALDAFSHSATSVLYRPQGHLTSRHQSLLWSRALQLMQTMANGGSLRLTGSDGAVMAESMVRVLSVSGRWDAAVGVLSRMDLAAKTMTSRLLVPTAATFVEAMCGCLVVGLTSYGTALLDLLRSMYEWNQVPHESISQLLQVCRRLDPQEGVVQRIVGEVLEAAGGAGTRTLSADRQVALRCLQLIARCRVPKWETNTSPWATALRLVAAYDANIWLQQPLARKGELSALFYAVRRFAKVYEAGIVRGQVERWLQSVFGLTSPEWEWWMLSESHMLPFVETWDEGVQMIARMVPRVAYLPVPLRQCKLSLLHSMVDRGARVEQSHMEALFAAGDVFPWTYAAYFMALDASQAATPAEAKRKGELALQLCGRSAWSDRTGSVHLQTLQFASDAMNVPLDQLEDLCQLRHAGLRLLAHPSHSDGLDSPCW